MRWRDRFAEPIDFLALAIARSKKGWRPTPAQKAAWAKKRAKAKLIAKRAANTELDRKRSEAYAARDRTPGAGKRFLAAFQPGHWYGVGDLINASGLKRDSCHAYLAKFYKQGILERTKNPAFERPGWKEPEWLYRLVEQVQRDVRDQGQRDTEAPD